MEPFVRPGFFHVAAVLDKNTNFETRSFHHVNKRKTLLWSLDVAGGTFTASSEMPVGEAEGGKNQLSTGEIHRNC